MNKRIYLSDASAPKQPTLTGMVKELLDPDFAKTIDWDHLAEPEDLEEPDTDFEYGNAKFPEKFDKIKILDDIEHKLAQIFDEIAYNKHHIFDLRHQLKTGSEDYEEFMGKLSSNVMDILSSGMTDEEKVKSLAPGFTQGGNAYKKLALGSHKKSMTKTEAIELVRNHHYIVDDIDTAEKELKEYEASLNQNLIEEQELEEKREEIYNSARQLVIINNYEKKIKELQKLKDELDSEDEIEILDKRIEGLEWKLKNAEETALEESYIFFNSEPSKYLLEALSDYEKIEAQAEELADEALIFYLRINTEFPAIVKAYKAGDIDDRWELSVIEGDNTALDEMEFDPEFSKMEVISYLTDIYGDIEEVDQEFVDEIIDDKKELDDDFYGIDESLNFEQGGDPYNTLGIGKRAQIEKWFKTWAPSAKYKIDDDLNIIVEGGGSFDFEGIPITSLPDNLTVRGYLYLIGTKITSLPKNLKVGGFLDLEDTPITSLSKNLKVAGYLDLRGTKITSLPDNLTVGGDLYLNYTTITSLPKNLKVKGKIYKDF